jgi:hypothetical protein
MVEIEAIGVLLVELLRSVSIVETFRRILEDHLAVEDVLLTPVGVDDTAVKFESSKMVENEVVGVWMVKWLESVSIVETFR